MGWITEPAKITPKGCRDGVHQWGIGWQPYLEHVGRVAECDYCGLRQKVVSLTYNAFGEPDGWKWGPVDGEESETEDQLVARVQAADERYAAARARLSQSGDPLQLLSDLDTYAKLATLVHVRRIWPIIKDHLGLAVADVVAITPIGHRGRKGREDWRQRVHVVSEAVTRDAGTPDEPQIVQRTAYVADDGTVWIDAHHVSGTEDASLISHYGRNRQIFVLPSGSPVAVTGGRGKYTSPRVAGARSVVPSESDDLLTVVLAATRSRAAALRV